MENNLKNIVENINNIKDKKILVAIFNLLTDNNNIKNYQNNKNSILFDAKEIFNHSKNKNLLNDLIILLNQCQDTLTNYNNYENNRKNDIDYFTDMLEKTEKKIIINKPPCILDILPKRKNFISKKNEIKSFEEDISDSCNNSSDEDKDSDSGEFSSLKNTDDLIIVEDENDNEDFDYEPITKDMKNDCDEEY